MGYPTIKDDILQSLKLSSQPFEPPTKGSEIFQSTSSTMLFNSLTKQLVTNDNIHLVIGEKSIGKSCLCTRLLDDNRQELSLYFYKAHKRPRIDDLFLRLAKDSSITGDLDAHELAVIAARDIFRQLRRNFQPVLIVDNAHRLPASVLRMLFRFYASIIKQDRGSLKIVLAGERKLESLWDNLGDAKPADKLVHTSLARPLPHLEIDRFLTHRFINVGLPTLPFTEKELKTIRTESGGLPGKIQELAASILNNKKIRT